MAQDEEPAAEIPWVVRTQELLGPYIVKPTLQEKRLSRPPFRFLWDIAAALDTNPHFCCRFGEKLFLTDEPPAEKDGKIKFIALWIDMVNEQLIQRNEPKVELDPNNVLRGSQCEETNIFLQSLAKLLSPLESSPKQGSAYPASETSADLPTKTPKNRSKKSDKSPKKSKKEEDGLSFRAALEKFNEINPEFAQCGTPLEETVEGEADDPFLKAQRLIMNKGPVVEDDEGSVESMGECPPSPKVPTLAVNPNSVAGRAQDLLDEIDRELDDLDAATAVAKEKAKKDAVEAAAAKEKALREAEERSMESPQTTPNTTFNKSYQSDTSMATSGTAADSPKIAVSPIDSTPKKAEKSKPGTVPKSDTEDDTFLTPNRKEKKAKFPKSKHSQRPRAVTSQCGNYANDDTILSDSSADSTPTHTKYPKSRNSQQPRCVASSPAPLSQTGSSPSRSPSGYSPDSSSSASKKYPQSKNTDRRPRAVASTAEPRTTPPFSDSEDEKKPVSKYPVSKNAQPPRCVAHGDAGYAYSPTQVDTDVGEDEDTEQDVGPLPKYPVSRTGVHGRTTPAIPSTAPAPIDFDNAAHSHDEETPASTPRQANKRVEPRGDTDVTGDVLMSELKSQLSSGWLPYMVDSLPKTLSDKHGIASVISCLQIMTDALGIRTAVDETVRDLVVGGLLSSSPAELMVKFEDHEELIEGLQCLIQAISLPNPLPGKLQCAK